MIEKWMFFEKELKPTFKPAQPLILKKLTST